MLTLPAEMQDRLDSGVTTLCWCWRVTRRDGAQFGFCEHDHDLKFDGLTFRAGSGFGAEDMDREAGFSTDQSHLFGALDAEVLTEADIEAGKWAGARVETFRVDWTDVSLRVRTGQAEIGEIRKRDGRFEAELLSLSHRLDASVGRLFARDCDAALGDARCGVSADHPDLALGCDKRLVTCSARFANAINFRGFPYMIGNDVLQASPAGEPVRDGGSREIAE